VRCGARCVGLGCSVPKAYYLHMAGGYCITSTMLENNDREIIDHGCSYGLLAKLSCQIDRYPFNDVAVVLFTGTVFPSTPVESAREIYDVFGRPLSQAPFTHSPLKSVTMFGP